MKTAIVLLAVLALGCAAPQPRKLFHEHVEDFLDVIEEEAGDELMELFGHYLEFDEFWVTLNYLDTSDFKNLIYEMESLPEFKAVVDFLENDNIDILYFIDLFNQALDQVVPRSRQKISGKDFSAYINDAIAEFPKSRLAALFDQKMAEDDGFRTAIENLQSEEWDRIWDALWENETFKAEAKVFADHGLDLEVLLDEIMAIFGQN